MDRVGWSRREAVQLLRPRVENDLGGIKSEYTEGCADMLGVYAGANLVLR